VRKTNERKEKARIEKKIADVRTTRGISTTKDLKNVEALIREETLPSFKFHVDVRYNKNSIDNRTKSFDTNSKTLNTQERICKQLLIII
jgi:hypothetical protein